MIIKASKIKAKILFLFIFLNYLISAVQNINDDYSITVEASGISFFSENTTEAQARIISVNEAKFSALEQICINVDVLSILENENLQLNEIKTFTAALLQTTIIHEERVIMNDNFALKITIKAKVDLNAMEERFKSYKESEIQKELFRIKLAKMNSLKKILEEYQDNFGLASAKQINELVNTLSISKLVNIGISSYTRKDYLDAIKYFNVIINSDSNDINALYYRGKSYLWQGKYENAIIDFTKIIDLEFINRDIFFDRALSYSHNGQIKKSLADYNFIIEHFKSDDYREYNNRAVLFKKLEMYHLALDDINYAISKSPPDILFIYYSTKGSILFDSKKYEDAIKNYSESIKLNQEYSPAYKERGNIYFLMNRYFEASEDFNTYLKLSKNLYGDADSIKAKIERMRFKSYYY